MPEIRSQSIRAHVHAHAHAHDQHPYITITICIPIISPKINQKLSHQQMNRQQGSARNATPNKLITHQTIVAANPLIAVSNISLCTESCQL